MTQPPQPAPPAQLRLGIWGPPGSGKTTYLAALRIAALRSDIPGNWIMNGTDPMSRRFLTDATDLLTDEHAFPVATEVQSNMVFRFTGERRVEYKPRFGRATVTTEPDAFELEVLDVPGGYYETKRASDPGLDDGGMEFPDSMADVSSEPFENSELLDHLQLCQGIIYLFDPERDFRQGDAFKYFHGTLEELAARTFQHGYTEPRLPHRVAVCITKFDQPYVYRTAFQRGFTVQDGRPPHFPLVEDRRAAEFFHALAKDDHTNTDLVASALRKYFFPDRVRYFVTTSVGFHIKNGRFNLQDHSNVARDEDGQYRIRGKVHPRNVLEPLLWMNESLKGGR